MQMNEAFCWHLNTILKIKIFLIHQWVVCDKVRISIHTCLNIATQNDKNYSAFKK